MNSGLIMHMTPRYRGACTAYSRWIGRVKIWSKSWSKISSLGPALAAVLLLGCSGESDSAEPGVQARDRFQAPGEPRPVRQANYGYPQMLPPSASREAARLPAKVESKLPIYEIRIDPQHLEMMDIQPHSPELHPITFAADGVTYENVKLRYRGAWARFWPKKPLKVFFSEEKLFNGQKRLNLNSGWRDAAFIRETLAYRIYEACGAPCSTSRLVRVHMNGELRGLYVEVEQPDKAFLKRRGLKGATIIKSISRNKMGDQRALRSVDEYQRHYEQETQKDEVQGMEELHKFCTELNRRNAGEFFEEHVDLEKFINYVAATVLCQNWDGFNKNHFLVYNANGSGKWFVLPWDLDRSLGDHWDWSFDHAELPIELGTSRQPGVTGWNRMIDRFFSDSKLRARFADRLQELLEKEFTPEKVWPIIDQMAADMAPEAKLDRQLWPVQDPDVENAVGVVKEFIKNRRTFLLAELPRFRNQTAAR